MKSITYRKYAHECLAMVELVTSQEAKDNLLAMAQCWHRLGQEAEEVERSDVVWAPGDDPSSPRAR